MDRVLLIGANHHVAPVEVRERLAFSSEQVHKALQELSKDEPFQELVILSTCNRTEFYIRSSDYCRAEKRLRSFLEKKSQLTQNSLNQFLYRRTGVEAVKHLMRVATGLDSLVVGEHEILGQVKDASEVAQQEGSTGPILSALFRYAIRAGKRAHSETDIGSTKRSVACVVVDLAHEICGPLDKHTALIIGAGKISVLTCKELVKAGLNCVFVTNRTYDKAKNLVNLLGEQHAQAVHFQDLESYLSMADIVICSTGAPHIVIHGNLIQNVMNKRTHQPLLIIDLAIPRDADPEIAKINNTYLKDIDDLQELADKHYPLTAEANRQAEEIAEEELGEFLVWNKAYKHAPLIRCLREKANAIVESELTDTLKHLGSLSPDQMQSIEKMSYSIVNKLLHDPIICLRNIPDNDQEIKTEELVKKIFGLYPEQPEKGSFLES